MVVGGFLGLLATAWTLIMPILVFAFFVVVIVEAGRRPQKPEAKSMDSLTDLGGI